jgi:hypothetical protein
MCRAKVYLIVLVIFFIFWDCKENSTVEPQIDTTPVNSINDAVGLTTQAYTLGYHYTLEPYFTFSRETNFASQSPSYDMTQIRINDLGWRQSYTLICSVKEDTVFSAEYKNLYYDTYERIMSFNVYYTFTGTGNVYDFYINDIIRDNQGRTEAYKADITAEVNGKTVSGILTYP